MRFEGDIQITKNFWLSELVPQREFEKFGRNSIWLLDFKIVSGAQLLRDELGAPCVINNWKGGGDFQYSGFRPADCSVGAEYSQHRFGRALDLKFKGISAKKVRHFIRDHYESLALHRFISTIEKDTPDWVHIDCRMNSNSQKLFEVNYK